MPKNARPTDRRNSTFITKRTLSPNETESMHISCSLHSLNSVIVASPVVTRSFRLCSETFCATPTWDMYSWTIRLASPPRTSRPSCNKIARWHNCRIAVILWLTNSTVRPSTHYVVHLAEAFLLELSVADRQHLVDDQNLRFQMRRDGKGEAHIHAAAVALYRRVEKFLDSRQSRRSRRICVVISARRHAEDGAVEKDVLAAGQFGVKAGADLEQAGDPAAQNRARPSSAR